MKYRLEYGLNGIEIGGLIVIIFTTSLFRIIGHSSKVLRPRSFQNENSKIGPTKNLDRSNLLVILMWLGPQTY